MSERAMQFGEQAHLAFTRSVYANWKGCNRGEVMSGWGDAAHMCDAIAADILREGTVRGKVRKDARAQAAAVKRAGDAIWAMRETVKIGGAR